jgi:threonyl-tRNA synthetase
MLQRIYATAFFKRADLEAYLHQLAEAEKRDHRKLGRALDLFDVKDEAGGGLVFWHPRGAVVREVMEQYLKSEYRRRGYQLVCTPHIAKADLWKTSGHLTYYREHMFTMDVDGQEYVVKPMNCPGHILIYKRRLHSYRELPVRLAEMGTVYRHELSGALHGLLRVRGFTQDDGHIFCTPEQLPPRWMRRSLRAQVLRASLTVQWRSACAQPARSTPAPTTADRGPLERRSRPRAGYRRMEGRRCFGPRST